MTTSTMSDSEILAKRSLHGSVFFVNLAASVPMVSAITAPIVYVVLYAYCVTRLRRRLPFAVTAPLFFLVHYLIGPVLIVFASKNDWDFTTTMVLNFILSGLFFHFAIMRSVLRGDYLVVPE